MSIISRVWLSSHWYDAGMYIMHSSGKLFMTFLGGYIKLSVLKIVMKKAYASEFLFIRNRYVNYASFRYRCIPKFL